MDWTDGYTADIEYTYGYYTELNPLRIKLAFLNAGIVPPKIESGCELGYGQGLSINIHAAAGKNDWFGTDFNPSQAAFAREMALIINSGPSLYDDSFIDFAKRTDLPDFDFISLHGIWSWISNENRAVIVDLIRRKLKPGGVLYISYNTLPGWASFSPMRFLLNEHSDVIGAQGQGIVSRIDEALNFADKLLDVNPSYIRANPRVVDRLQTMKGHKRKYLAHEYFNRDWLPMHFSSMAKWLSPAKMQFACSANYLDHVAQLNLTVEQQKLLTELPDPMFRETVKDFMVNQQFRRDYWIKGARYLSALERSETLRLESVILIIDRVEAKLSVAGSLGDAKLQESLYAPVLDCLANNKPKTIGEIERELSDKLNLTQIVQAIIVFIGANYVSSAQDEHTIAAAKKRTDKINSHLLNLARSRNECTFLASPVTGGGVPVGRSLQLLLLAVKNGKVSPDELARATWDVISSQGQKLIKNGKVLEKPEDNIAELSDQAFDFINSKLPILRKLQVI